MAYYHVFESVLGSIRLPPGYRISYRWDEDSKGETDPCLLIEGYGSRHYYHDRRDVIPGPYAPIPWRRVLDHMVYLAWIDYFKEVGVI